MTNSSYAVALEICGLTDAQALEMYSAIYPDVDPPPAGDPKLWEMLAELYLQMQIEADRIGSNTDFTKHEPEFVQFSVRQGKFPAGSIARIRAMATLMALAFQTMDPKRFARLGKDDQLH